MSEDHKPRPPAPPDQGGPAGGRLDAVQVHWSRPGQGDSRGGVGFTNIPPLESLVTAVGVLMWQRHNGRVRLYTDSAGLRHYEHKGLAGLWDAIDTEVLNTVPDTLDAAVFWDIGKTFALDHEPCPVAYLDLDMIVWSCLSPFCAAPAHFFHWEEPSEPWYVGPDQLSTPPDYRFDPKLDWSLWACNTALLYIADARFKDALCRASWEFAVHNRPRDGVGLAEMLFAVQRLYAMVAQRCGVEARPFVEYCHGIRGPSRWLCQAPPVADPLSPFAFESGFPFTHLWASKHRFRRDPEAALSYGALLVRRCLQEVPGGGDVLAGVPEFAPYLRGP